MRYNRLRTSGLWWVGGRKPKPSKIIMKTISVLALTAVALLSSCQQQQGQTDTTTTTDVQTVDNTVNK